MIFHSKYFTLLAAISLLSTLTANARDVGLWTPTPFDESATRLPRGYWGVDAKQFHALFKSKVAKIIKSEFETTEEFERRSSDLKKILSPISSTKPYAFRIENMEAEYDADTRSFRFKSIGGPYSCGPSGLAGLDREPLVCDVALVSYSKDRYQGLNAFGRSATVNRTRGAKLALTLPTSHNAIGSVFTLESGYFAKAIFTDRVEVPIEKARAVKELVSVLFVGYVTEAKVIEGPAIIAEPTISSPRDVIVTTDVIPFNLKRIVYYVISTGEILGQRAFEEEVQAEHGQDLQKWAEEREREKAN